MSLLKATRSHVLLLIATALLVALPHVRDAEAMTVLTETSGVARGADGWMRLGTASGPAPQAMGTWERWGMWDSPPSKLEHDFSAVRVHYRDDVPVGTQRFVAVRASGDGRQWSEWEWNVSDGRVVMFQGERRWIQHRIVLLGGADRSPAVSPVTISPETVVQAKRTPNRTGEPLAPTYRLRATRQGMVGRRTANGSVIKPNDFFVSLPSWKVLSSKGGSEYMVRLSANGKNVDVRVADVGPWNRQDNFWDANRTTYTDLPVGWPQDHAAFFENHNGRRSEKGWVRHPSAVDIGDGAYKALGLKGAQATVDITFLWLGKDPGPNPQPLNSHPSRRPSPPLYVEPSTPTAPMSAVVQPDEATPEALPIVTATTEAPGNDDVTLAPTEP